jgi:predicted transcriptional regulator
MHRKLEDDHPRRRFVLAMRRLAAEQACWKRPYDDTAAAGFARTRLMPEPAWRQAAGDSDVELAEVFNVPVEQVRHRRTELARSGWWQLAPEAI